MFALQAAFISPGGICIPVAALVAFLINIQVKKKKKCRFVLTRAAPLDKVQIIVHVWKGLWCMLYKQMDITFKSLPRSGTYTEYISRYCKFKYLFFSLNGGV